MEYTEPILPEESDVHTDEWDPDDLLWTAEAMSQLKVKTDEKASANIEKSQKQDKHYYNLEHSDPCVRW